MALTRRATQRMSGSIWPGFVDAMTALLLVLMFVLTIFMVVQTMLRDTISGQEHELDALVGEVDALARALGLEQARAGDLEGQIAALRSQLGDAEARGASFEAQVAALLADKDDLTRKLGTATAAQAAEAATSEALRDRLKAAGTELTAMTLDLEAKRREAEETLTLLAAAQTEKEALAARLAENLSEAEKQAGLLALADQTLADKEKMSAEAERKVALLNEQLVELRRQLSALQAVLDDSRSQDVAAQVQIETLTGQLNAALARVATEQRKRAALEEAERLRIEAEARRLAEEAKRLENYRSEFFGRLRDILGDREGVRIVGDRFVFSSEVLFAPGSAQLSEGGQAQIARVAATLQDIAGEIPAEIDWVIRVDGHTDNTPLSGQGQYADNWELSQARSLSVVRYMTGTLGFPPDRLVAAGFGEFQPEAEGDSPDALAQNRRIELKLTEK